MAQPTSPGANSPVTIFSIPKPFQGHSDIIQRNAINSWISLRPKCQIILLGDDEGVSQAAEEYQVRHIPDVRKNEFGTPLLSSAFQLAQEAAVNDFLVYVNTDIIFFQDFIDAVQHINKHLFLMAGQRWDLNINQTIDFSANDWQEFLFSKLKRDGIMHGPSGLDYFIFPRSLQIDLPDFTVGRQGWDNWLLWKCKAMGIPLIDATRSVMVIHQNHDFSHSRYGEKLRVGGPEVKANIDLAGGFMHFSTLRDADFLLDHGCLRRPHFLKRFMAVLFSFYIFRALLGLKRKIGIRLVHEKRALS